MSAAPVAVATAALAGRTILVAGAHGGLGRAASIACAHAGASVVILGRNLRLLNGLLDKIRATGGDASAYPLDLEGASPDDYRQMAARIEAEFAQLHGVLHCAADFRGLTPLQRTDPADFARAIHVNLTARWWLTQACLPLLARASGAAIVFALDNPARVGGAYWGGYGLAQAAQASLVGMLQAELGSKGVRVSALRPGPMRTALRARAYAADEDLSACYPDGYADACVHLLSVRGEAQRGQVWAPEPVHIG